MIFDDIVGQKFAINNIKNAIKSKRVAHAYLFCGPDGVGKSITASVFACTLNCREKGINPCGHCHSCIKAEAGNHPDIIHFGVKPHSTGKQSIGVDDIRDLQMDMLKKPYEDGIKVYIMHDASKMTEQAQNALLKTLEEPPEHTMIIMLTSNLHSLLDTIISRCQVLRFTRASEKEIENYLIKTKGVSFDEAKVTAAFADGIVKKALAFTDDDKFKKARNEVIDIAKGLYKGDKLFVLSKVEYFIDNRDDIENIFDIMASFFRDLLVYKETQDKNLIINLDWLNTIETESVKYSKESLYNIINNIKETASSMRYNVNYQLAIENMLLSIQEGQYGNCYRYKV